MSLLSRHTDGVVVFCRRVDARVLQQPVDDGEMSVHRTHANREIVVNRWIDVLDSQQPLDNVVEAMEDSVPQSSLIKIDSEQLRRHRRIDGSDTTENKSFDRGQARLVGLTPAEQLQHLYVRAPRSPANCEPIKRPLIRASVLNEQLDNVDATVGRGDLQRQTVARTRIDAGTQKRTH